MRTEGAFGYSCSVATIVIPRVEGRLGRTGEPRVAEKPSDRPVGARGSTYGDRTDGPSIRGLLAGHSPAGTRPANTLSNKTEPFSRVVITIQDDGGPTRSRCPSVAVIDRYV